MRSEPRTRPVVSPVGIDPQGWPPGASAHSRPLVAAGLGVMVCLVLLGLSVVAGTFVVHTVSAALLRDSQGSLRSGSRVSIPAQQSNLKLQSRLVDQRSVAVAEYAAQFTEFKTATARPPGAGGINLAAWEVRRRDDVLTGLVLQCINAVDRYNLGATALSATQLRSAGLPERYVWSVDCAPGK